MNYLEVAVLAVEVPRGLMDRITGFKLQHKIVLRSQLTLHKFILMPMNKKIRMRMRGETRN